MNQNSDELKPCPCGKIPKELGVYDANQGAKWAWVNADCCGEWAIEFRTQYKPFDSPECMQLAKDAWNAASRPTPQVSEGLDEFIELLIKDSFYVDDDDSAHIYLDNTLDSLRQHLTSNKPEDKE